MPSNVKTGERKRQKKRTKKSSEHDGSDGDLELDRELYPIGHYISDRAEMIEQMFTILKKDKIQSMLPPILKDFQWQDLKAHCLEQLNSMSEKQITRILDGKPYAPDLEENDESKRKPSVDIISSSSSSSSSSSLTSSSCGESSAGSSVSSDSENEQSTRKKTKDKKIEKVNLVKAEPDKVEDDPDMLQIGLSPKEMGDLLEEEENTEKKVKEEPIDTGTSKKDKTNNENNPEKKSEVKEGKTLLEILELEMRARAIRALLKQSGAQKAGDVKLENSNSKKRSESKSSSKNPQASEPELDNVPVTIKEEVVSEEEVEADIVFVKESLAPPKEPKKKPQKESLSAVYNVSADILQFKPTVLSSTPKLSLVDTSGNPIVLPKVKSHKTNKNHDGSVIVIDGDLQEASSSKSNIEHEGENSQKGSESNMRKRKSYVVIDLENTESDVVEMNTELPKSSAETMLVVNNPKSPKTIVLDRNSNS